MTKSTILIAVITLFLFSCGNMPNENASVPGETGVHKKHQHSMEILTIELNNGEKWRIDTTMRTYIRNMEHEIISYVMIGNSDYKSLAEKLQSNLDLLSSTCTMKGKAHDELHKWLLPYIDLVKGLSNAKDVLEVEKQIQKIQSSLDTFNQYFR